MTDISILAVGDSGTGKTEFIRTLPKPFVFDFDKGLATIADTELYKNKHYITVKDVHPKGKPLKNLGLYAYGEAWPAFITKLNEIGDQMDKGICPYESLVFDSLTTMADICMNNVLKNDNKIGQAPQIQHWGAQINALQQVLDLLTSWPGVKYLTAHVQRNENQITETQEMLPLVTGKLAGKVSIYFDEVYFTDIKVTGTGDNRRKNYMFITESDMVRRQCKSRNRVPTGITQDWNEIKKHLHVV